MTASSLRAGIACLLVALTLVLNPAAAAGSAPLAFSSGIVTLLAPATGTAFAFGRPGHLLTTRRAVHGLTAVELVTAGGRTERAPVVSTSNAAIVQLRGPLVLKSFHGTSRGAAGGVVEVVSGPLNGPHEATGALKGTGRDTTIASAPRFDGSPVLNSRGLVIGVATTTGGHLVVLPTAGLRVTAPATTGGSSSPLIWLLPLILAIVIGVMLARASIATRTARRRKAAHDARHRPPSSHRRPPGSRQPRSLPREPESETARLSDDAAPDEPDTGLHIIIRPHEEDGPLPDVRLRPRSTLGDTPASPGADRQDNPR